MTRRQMVAALRAAERDYRRFHWGNLPTAARRVSVRRPSVLVEVGELVSLTYRTAKGGGRRDDWIHFHRPPRPRLAYDLKSGDLFLVGGGYRITPRGIED